MILHNAIGLESDIQSLLEKSILHMDSIQIRAWMKYEFDPSSMFCMIVDNRVVSCLQTKRKVFYNGNNKCMATVFTMAATLPDYRQRKYFSSLLEAALNKSSANDLLTIVYTTFPKLFESRSFYPISKTLKYCIPAYKCEKGNDKNVFTYHEEMDLFPVYEAFLSNFNGCIHYTKKELDTFLNYQIASNKKIIVTKHDNEITGFLIYKNLKDFIRIDYMMYLDSASVYDAFHYLSLRISALSFVVSEYERFEKLFLLDYPRQEGTILVRLNHYKLFSQWTNMDITNAKQYFEQLNQATWMHMID